MISIEECKKHLNDLELSDKKIEEIRDVLYAVVENMIDGYTPSDTVLPTDNLNDLRQNISIKEEQ